jgi:VanZ family protein
MIRTEKRIRLCAVLLVLVLAFIWGNSLLPREASQAFSDGFRELLLRFLPHGGTHAGQGSGQLRKIAHFAEFALLGLLLRWLLGMLKKRIYLPILLGVAAACVDETIQIFVPGRGPGIRDVWIDSCGVLTGVILLTLGHTIMKIIHGFFGGK